MHLTIVVGSFIKSIARNFYVTGIGKECLKTKPMREPHSNHGLNWSIILFPVLTAILRGFFFLVLASQASSFAPISVKAAARWAITSTPSSFERSQTIALGANSSKIRDASTGFWHLPATGLDNFCTWIRSKESVSYTHLTLPTIYSV